MADINIGHVFERVGKWNEKRYDRVYNHELSVALLEEELQEFHDAKTDVDRLDALCDIVYVAMGVIWKNDVKGESLIYNSEEAHEQVLSLLDTNTMDPIYFASAILARFKHNEEYPAILAMSILISICMTQMTAFGLSTLETLEALFVVCDSNDSKSIKKTAAHLKANGGDKGEFFITPEPRLADILSRAEIRNHGY